MPPRDPLTGYTNIKSLYCTPETNNVTYLRKKKYQKEHKHMYNQILNKTEAIILLNFNTFEIMDKWGIL